MAAKTSVSGIVRDHFDTLRDARTMRVGAWDLAIQFALPGVVGTFLPLFGVRLVDVGQIIAGVAVLAGFTFGLLVFVFQLRMQISHDPRVIGTALRRLIDQLFTNVAYAVVVGLVDVVIAVALVSIRIGSEDTAVTTNTAGAVGSGTLIAVTTHFILVLGMCTKRAYRAYQRVS